MIKIPPVSKSRQILLWWLAFYMAFSVLTGLIDTTQAHPALELVVVVSPSIFTYLWCKAESSERNVAPSSVLTMFAVLFAPIGFPIYFLRTGKPLGASLKLTGKASGSTSWLSC